MIHLQDMKCDSISNCRVAEIGPDVTCRHGDASVQPMCRGESFDHGGGHTAPFNPVTMLEQRHRPTEFPHRYNLYLVGQRGDLLAKLVLNISWKSSNRFGEFAGHLWIGKGGAKPK